MLPIIDKLKSANLKGRSGSQFPVFLKWESVKSIASDRKFVICNASEGEIDTFKDKHILKNYASDVIFGIKVAMEELSAEKGYLYLNKDYFTELFDKINQEIGVSSIEIIKKEGGYIGGEETSVIESLEGNFPEPKIKPPFPATEGLWGYPTLVSNVETFYCVSKIEKGEYEQEKFYSIEGDAMNKGVFKFHEETPVKEILEKSGNLPDFDYFLQTGGGAGGQILLPEETNLPMYCLGSIIIYNRKAVDLSALMKKWVNFFLYNNCDKCTPCREGLYRIMEMIESNDFSNIDDIFFIMQETPLCPLAKVAVNPFKTLLEKIIIPQNENKN